MDVTNGNTQSTNGLFKLLCGFSTDVIVGYISSLYRSKKFGPKFLTGDAYVHIILPVFEEYANICAWLITSREDSYINEIFDAMTREESKYNPICLLQLSVMLVLSALRTMNIADVVIYNGIYAYETTMRAVRAHVVSIIMQHQNKIGPLTGCAKDHIHLPIDKGEKIFTFTTDKYVETESGPVKLTTL